MVKLERDTFIWLRLTFRNASSISDLITSNLTSIKKMIKGFVLMYI